MSPEDEYEIIPTSPMRRLEKRLEQVESGSYSSEVRKLIEQIMELIKANQRIIDDTIKANHDLITEVAKVPKSIEDLIGEMKDFMGLLKASAEEEAVAPQIPKDLMNPVVDKMDQLIAATNKQTEAHQASLSTLSLNIYSTPIWSSKPLLSTTV